MSHATMWRQACLFDANEGPSKVYRELYALRLRRRFPAIDTALAAIDVGDFSARVLVGILVATAADACRLSEREGFFKRVRDRLVSDMGADRARQELAGLACEEGWSPAKEAP